jgi:hypothetical protein
MPARRSVAGFLGKVQSGSWPAVATAWQAGERSRMQVANLLRRQNRYFKTVAKEEQNDLLDQTFDFHLYMGMEFTRQVKAAGIIKIKDLQNISLQDFLKVKAMTIARLRRIVLFMDKHHLCFKQVC